MKMSFVPGKLELTLMNGIYVVSVQGQPVMQTRAQKEAVKAFNELRRRMEKEFPPVGPSEEELKLLLRRTLADIAVDQTLRRPPKKRSTARSSRTFGG